MPLKLQGLANALVKTAAVTCALVAVGCAQERQEGATGHDTLEAQSAAVSPNASTFPAKYARQWMTALANSVRTDVISPPVASRTYAYGAIGIYEAVVHGMPGYQSLAGQLNGLPSLPQPDPGASYDWPTVLASTLDAMFNTAPDVPPLYVYPERLFFEYTTGSQATLQTLGRVQIGYRKTAGVPQPVLDASISYGRALGGALYAWAQSDGYLNARYKGWIPPKGPDKWVPTGFSDTDKVANPVEPHFGELRPLVMTSPSECAPPPPVPFSTTPGSDMYLQADAVYQTEQTLTDEQREIASFWADGPGATPTPPGHWLALATQFTRTGTLADAAKGYVLTSIGYYDSFIAVWQSKYQYNLLRPETYIRRHIDPSWKPFLPTPQFPEYVSGHSGVSGAAAVTFTATFGNVGFTDNTKLRRGFAARSFTSFSQAAQEAAMSRLYGGIHYPMANSNGISLGTCVGNAVVSRVQLM